MITVFPGTVRVLRNRLTDHRGGTVLFVSHCLLNENTRYMGGAFCAGQGAQSASRPAAHERGPPAGGLTVSPAGQTLGLVEIRFTQTRELIEGERRGGESAGPTAFEVETPHELAFDALGIGERLGRLPAPTLDLAPAVPLVEP